jgi:hypothetical protein
MSVSLIGYSLLFAIGQPYPGTPAAPEPPVPSTPAPEYAASCTLVDREGRVNQLNVEVANLGIRQGKVTFASRSLSALRGSPTQFASNYTSDWRDGWTRSDYLIFQNGARQLVLKVTTNDDSPGAAVEVADKDGPWGLPLHAGMCRTDRR